MGGIATTYIGWKILFKSALLKGTISTTGKAQSVLTHIIDNIFQLSIHGTVDLMSSNSGSSNFGLSLTFGGG